MNERPVAYFSMEIAIDDEIPTFSGGLGVLAGDFLRSASDTGVPAVAVTLLYRLGFFRQELDDHGAQVEFPVRWSPEDRLERLDTRVTVTIAGRPVAVGVWRYRVIGVSGGETPIYFLDTGLDENDPRDRAITDRLYGGDPAERLSQEAVLGLAGPAMLRALGHLNIATFHMNEGHASLVPVSLLADLVDGALAGATKTEIDAVRTRCVFTTHTPVPAGHDRFAPDVVKRILGEELVDGLQAIGCLENDSLNMTLLGMFFSRFINGVAKRHGEVAQAMFPQFRVEAITNGVHVRTWAAPSTVRLFDEHLPRWREDNAVLRDAESIPLEEVAAAHIAAKRALLDEVARRSGIDLDPSALTVGFARRAAPYKRTDLLLSDPDELRSLLAEVGPLQVLYSGKAHPNDRAGKDLIENVGVAAKALHGTAAVVYLPDYGMALAALLVAGVDVWLNNPLAPLEASGTSGMKAAVNGVPSLSVVDGWWVEGWVEGVTGWAIGPDRGATGEGALTGAAGDARDAAELRRVLSEVVAPLYYERPEEFAAVGRSAIALNGPHFTTQRMVTEYAARAYGHTALTNS